ncbi:MAG: DUF6597 domain-containing transcriptional factor, partial [Mycobacteriales bacterium]
MLARPDRVIFALRRQPPAPDLAWCIENYWILEWHRAGLPREAEVLPHPSVNLALEDGTPERPRTGVRRVPPPVGRRRAGPRGQVPAGLLP